MPTLELKPKRQSCHRYYDKLWQNSPNSASSTKPPFAPPFRELLEHCARQFDWKLVPEYAIKTQRTADAKQVRAARRPAARLWKPRIRLTIWKRKSNTSSPSVIQRITSSFGSRTRPCCFQNGERFLEADLAKPDGLVLILTRFLDFAQPAIAEWEKAVEEFKTAFRTRQTAWQAH